MGLDPWFGPDHVPSPDSEYVLWVDLMGTSAVLDWKLTTGAVNIGKLQTSIIESEHSDDVSIYPMMDGVYITSPADDIGKLTKEIFHKFSHILTNRFNGYQKANLEYAPILRAGVAYGQVIHGYNLSDTKLADHKVSDSIIIGDAVAKAHQCETNAPPFGIRLDSSLPGETETENLEWWSSNRRAKEILEAYEEYLKFFEENDDISYSNKKIKNHRSEAREYLG
jgi:hypothetical protein